MTEIVTIETKSLGDRSYVVSDGEVAAVIDPQRDIDRVLAVVERLGVRITHVFETHVHNDYVTGGLALARRVGAVYVLSAAEKVEFDHVGVADDDEIPVGRFIVRAVQTPGHTPHHMSYVVSEAGRPCAVFTGGSMLYGTVGRTDLIADDQTEELTRAQYRSVRRLAAELPDYVAVQPTHGFGSFCSSTEASGTDSSNIAIERTTNVALTGDDEDLFVETLLSGLTAYPRYYAHMGDRNRQGPAEPDLSPPTPVDPVELRRRIHAGDWVVDLRTRQAFAHSHLAGTVNVALDDKFVTYLGWTIPWGTPVTLVGDTVEEVAAAQRDLARIGIDRPAGTATGGLHEWAAGGELRSYRRATFVELADEIDRADVVVLDVRRDDEWSTGHLDRAVHMPLDQLEDRLSEIPDGRVWVHCGSGYRASIAASLLERAGHTVVLIDDDWTSVQHQPHLAVAGSPPSP
ncbi:MAG: MBL fold metallo-hydrolase [Ilumatobacteraceae bacterium]